MITDGYNLKLGLDSLGNSLLFDRSPESGYYANESSVLSDSNLVFYFSPDDIDLQNYPTEASISDRIAGKVGVFTNLSDILFAHWESLSNPISVSLFDDLPSGINDSDDNISYYVSSDAIDLNGAYTKLPRESTWRKVAGPVMMDLWSIASNPVSNSLNGWLEFDTDNIPSGSDLTIVIVHAVLGNTNNAALVQIDSNVEISRGYFRIGSVNYNLASNATWEAPPLKSVSVYILAYDASDAQWKCKNQLMSDFCAITDAPSNAVNFIRAGQGEPTLQGYNAATIGDIYLYDTDLSDESNASKLGALEQLIAAKYAITWA